jgi:adenylate cyclase class 2
MEVEAKFFIKDLEPFRQTLARSGARQASPRLLELNHRYDTPDLRLSRNNEVLRLRERMVSTLTYKRTSGNLDIREEIEIEVDDPHRAHLFISALGFVVSAIYEKYREVFDLPPCHVMLDELPFGQFVEIEGPDLDQVRETAVSLELPWSHRIQAIYKDIFHQIQGHYHLTSRDLTFDNFERAAIDLETLGYTPINIQDE